MLSARTAQAFGAYAIFIFFPCLVFSAGVLVLVILMLSGIFDGWRACVPLLWTGDAPVAALRSGLSLAPLPPPSSLGLAGGGFFWMASWSGGVLFAVAVRGRKEVLSCAGSD